MGRRRVRRWLVGGRSMRPWLIPRGREGGGSDGGFEGGRLQGRERLWLEERALVPRRLAVRTSVRSRWRRGLGRSDVERGLDAAPRGRDGLYRLRRDRQPRDRQPRDMHRRDRHRRHWLQRDWL